MHGCFVVSLRDSAFFTTVTLLVVCDSTFFADWLRDHDHAGVPDVELYGHYCSLGGRVPACRRDLPDGRRCSLPSRLSHFRCVCVCTCACARVCDVAVGQSLCQFPFTFSKLLRGLLLCEKPVAY